MPLDKYIFALINHTNPQFVNIKPMETVETIHKRQSIRAFLDKPVSKQTITDLFEVAKYSPSSVNSQPWKIAIVQGKSLENLSANIIKASDEKPRHDMHYYPDRWFEPYLARRRACGLALYSALEISRREIEKQKEHRRNNFRFFGAPVGVLFFVDRKLASGSLVDIGMIWQTIMLTATDMHLGTCALGSLVEYPDVVKSTLNISDDYMVVGGMALGYPDMDHPANSFRTDREELKEILWQFD